MWKHYQNIKVEPSVDVIPDKEETIVIPDPIGDETVDSLYAQICKKYDTSKVNNKKTYEVNTQILNQAKDAHSKGDMSELVLLL